MLIPLPLLALPTPWACTPNERQRLEPALIEGLSLRRIGVGDRRLSYFNSVFLDPEAGTDAWVLQTTHTYGTGRLVRYQPSTDRTEYIELTGAQGAWAAARRGEDVYIGSHMPGVLYRMRTGGLRLRPIPIPRREGERFEFVWSIDFGSDGNLYLGTYPEAAPLRYQRDTGVFEHLGVVAPGENYIRHVNGKFPGKIFCGIGAHAQLVEADLATGKTRAFLPERFRDRSFVYCTIASGICFWPWPLPSRCCCSSTRKAMPCYARFVHRQERRDSG